MKCAICGKEIVEGEKCFQIRAGWFEPGPIYDQMQLRVVVTLHLCWECGKKVRLSEIVKPTSWGKKR